MQTGVNNHGQSIHALNTGRITRGPARARLVADLRPGLGERRTCRRSCVLTDPASLPVLGVDNWSNGWLPSLYQGTVDPAREPRILDLDPPPHLQGRAAGAAARLPRRSSTASTSTSHPGEHDLDARIAILRAGRADADGRQGGARPVARERRDAAGCTAWTIPRRATSARAA